MYKKILLVLQLVTTSDDNTVRVWRYDSTADIRKKLGRTDISCGITGSAERTHRDIGTDMLPVNGLSLLS
jgi:WD40 repeat protein